MSNIILTKKTLKSESQEDKNKEKENEKLKEENENKNENEDDDDYYENKIKGKKYILDEMIDKSKSFEEQIKLLKKRKDLEGFYPDKDYDDKELKSKYFKIELAKLSNEIDEKLFEEIFGHTLTKLTDKLINTTKKEENQIIADSIKINKYKLLERNEFSDWVIKPNRQRINLLDTIDLILNFNKTIQLDLV